MSITEAEISREKYYTANRDFTSPRMVTDHHETVAFQSNGLTRIWMNEQPLGYESHWHPALEIIIPVENIYTAVCEGSTQVIEPYQIFIIPPGVIHELTAPETGRRFIFLMNISSISRMRSFSRISAILSRPLLLTKEQNDEVYDDIYTYQVFLIYK